MRVLYYLQPLVSYHPYRLFILTEICKVLCLSPSTIVSEKCSQQHSRKHSGRDPWETRGNPPGPPRQGTVIYLQDKLHVVYSSV